MLWLITFFPLSSNRLAMDGCRFCILCVTLTSFLTKDTSCPRHNFCIISQSHVGFQAAISILPNCSYAHAWSKLFGYVCDVITFQTCMAVHIVFNMLISISLVYTQNVTSLSGCSVPLSLSLGVIGYKLDTNSRCRFKVLWCQNCAWNYSRMVQIFITLPVLKYTASSLT